MTTTQRSRRPVSRSSAWRIDPYAIDDYTWTRDEFIAHRGDPCATRRPARSSRRPARRSAAR